MFSVIICAHNPNPEYFKRVLQALFEQDLDRSLWECLIVDNASSEPVKSLVPSDLRSQIHMLYEATPGLTHARLCGFLHAKFDWLVLVDDDNVLRSDYLSTAQKKILQNKQLGVIGGRIIPEFEVEPANEILPYLDLLALRDIQEDFIGKSYEINLTPIGAGMIIRKEVATYYQNLLEHDPLRKSLDRKGKSLMSSGDVDLAHCAVDLGFDIGLFKQLELIHLIPKFRVAKQYILQINRYVYLSNHLLFHIRFKRIPRIPDCKRTVIKHLRFWKRGQWFESAMLHAAYRGTREAHRRVQQLMVN